MDLVGDGRGGMISMGVIWWRGWSMMRCIALCFANEMWMHLFFLDAVHIGSIDVYEMNYS